MSQPAKKEHNKEPRCIDDEQLHGVKLKVNFEDARLGPHGETTNFVKKTASNLNREAKLKWQSDVINKKRDRDMAANHTPRLNNNLNNVNNKIKYFNNSFNQTDNYNNNNNNNEFLKCIKPNQLIVADMEEDADNICNLNVPKQVLNNFNSNTNKSFEDANNKNEIIVKSIKILAVSKESCPEETSDSDACSNDNNLVTLASNSKEAFKVSNRAEVKQTNLMSVAPLPDDHFEDSIIEIKTEDKTILNEDEEEAEEENEDEGEETDDNDDDTIDLSIFELLDKNSKKFILKPATMGLTLKCQIFRHKGIYSQYKFYLENLEGQLLLIMTARKRKKTKTTCYIINYITYDETNVEKYIETPIAKLKSNLMGTQFTLYDFGIKPNVNMYPSMNGDLKAHSSNFPSESFDEAASINESDLKLLRKEYLSISYEFNIFGYKGPRQMSLIIPGMDNQFNREDFVVKNETDSLLNAWRLLETNINKNRTPAATTKRFSIKKTSPRVSFKHKMNKERKNNEFKHNGEEAEVESTSSKVRQDEDVQVNVVKLVNKSPGWHPQYRSFALNFNGRVTQPSVKNYQIVHEVNTDYIVTQFGKVNPIGIYTCDYSYPLCSLQAFGIAISSLDNKIGCD